MALRPITVHRFGKKLVAVRLQSIDINIAGLDRPEPAATGFVTQISFAIGGADEHALARLDYFHAAIARPVAFDRAGDESLEQRRLGAAHGVHFGNFDQPFAAQVL